MEGSLGEGWEVGRGVGFELALSNKDIIVFSLLHLCLAKGKLWYGECSNYCKLDRNMNRYRELWKITFKKMFCGFNNLSGLQLAKSITLLATVLKILIVGKL